MDCSTLGLPVHQLLPELTQTHIHQVGDAIKPSHPLLSPSLPAFNLSQHQGLFQGATSSHQVAKVLEFQLPVDIQDWFPLGLTGWISLQSKGLSRVFLSTTALKHQFFGAQPSLWNAVKSSTWEKWSLCILTWPWPLLDVCPTRWPHLHASVGWAWKQPYENIVLGGESFL